MPVPPVGGDLSCKGLRPPTGPSGRPVSRPICNKARDLRRQGERRKRRHSRQAPITPSRTLLQIDKEGGRHHRSAGPVTTLGGCVTQVPAGRSGAWAVPALASRQARRNPPRGKYAYYYQGGEAAAFTNPTPSARVLAPVTTLLDAIPPSSQDDRVPSVSVCDRFSPGAGRPERWPAQIPASAAAVAW